jgi:hypothetical protein
MKVFPSSLVWLRPLASNTIVTFLTFNSLAIVFAPSVTFISSNVGEDDEDPLPENKLATPDTALTAPPIAENRFGIVTRHKS